jgi:hypothetical protein
MELVCSIHIGRLVLAEGGFLNGVKAASHHHVECLQISIVFIRMRTHTKLYRKGSFGIDADESKASDC